METLNQYSGALTLLFSGLVAVSTVVYAILTWRLVSETRKMRQAQTEPIVAIDIRPSELWINLIDVVIENVGLGPAYDIKFDFDNDMKIRKNKALMDINMFKNGINYLSPRQKIQFFLTSLLEDTDEKVKTEIKVDITYQNSIGKKIKSHYVLDFSQFLGMSQLGKPPIKGIEKHLENIYRELHSLTFGSRKLKVDIYDRQDREAALREIEEEYGESEQKTEELSDGEEKGD